MAALPDPRRQQLVLVAQVEIALRRVLMVAARDAEIILRQSELRIGGQISQAQLLLVLAQLRLLSERLWGTQVPDEISRVMALAAAEIAKGSSALDRFMIAHTDNPKVLQALDEAEQQRARRVAQVLETREREFKFDLSPSVYKWEALTDGMVERVISSGMALGKTQRQIAKDVRGLINPNARGGVSYAAIRLGRTEVANAYHAQTIAEYRDNPFVTGLRWNLSNSHPVPDECNELADGGDLKGKGVFRVQSVPLKPHPQCLCYLTPDTVTQGRFVDKVLNGDYNAYLLAKYPDLDPSGLP